MQSSDLSSVLCCPRCERGSLTVERAGYICERCSAGYPVVGGVPWLFPEPSAALGEWRGRLKLLQDELDAEGAECVAALGGEGRSPATRERLGRLVAAYADQRRRLDALLAPLGVQDGAPRETLLALRTRMPLEQGLTNYYVNVHRDYAWGDAENEASLALLESAMTAPLAGRRLLVLGAGAGRLALDLHRSQRPALTVAADFNPLLLFVAREMYAGRELELHEFPIAPRTLDDHAVLRRLRAGEGGADDRLHLLAADALHAPFAAGAFDAVLTPWLIDILPVPLAAFAGRVNRLLAPGGHWLNLGSLAFAQKDRAARHGIEEVREILDGAGFGARVEREAELPYMRSPASRHARIERVLAWSTTKEREAESLAMAESRLPAWLVKGDEPVPLLPEFRLQAATTRIHAALMGLIDGQRSLRDIAQLLVDSRLMRAGDAEPAVRTFLTRMYE